MRLSAETVAALKSYAATSSLSPLNNPQLQQEGGGEIDRRWELDQHYSGLLEQISDLEIENKNVCRSICHRGYGGLTRHLSQLELFLGSRLFTEPANAPAILHEQLQTIKDAYDYLLPTPPILPPENSPIPTLLALQSTQKTVNETRAAIKNLQESIENTFSSIEQQEDHHKDLNLIKASLEERIASLRHQKLSRLEKSSEQKKNDLIDELSKKRTTYQKKTKDLIRGLKQFVDEHLSAMLAAEELGGPIVGELAEIDDEMLKKGFSQQGKAKRLKPAGHRDNRQRRIDDIWGPADAESTSGGDEDMDAENERSEKGVAAQEIKQLIEDLLNLSVEGGSGGSGAYLELPRDSAAARFLVRAKVAQYHPKDARRLRLIDFALDLAD
ncbi:MAG: hypothetical protein M1829_005260 [Trizodia sp. TS-e1964]|nr:MAG: hypothetical protein M1829_005260 [Trizodia sp. TS-e1964]